MRTVSYRLDDLRKAVIHIGRVAENDCTRVQIDAGEIYAEYPHASAALTVQPPEGEAYPAVVTRDGNMVVWDVPESALTADGTGEIQLTFTSGSTVVKSAIGRINICRSIVAEGEAPDPLEDFLAEAGEALTAIPETIDAALEAAKESGEFDGPAGADGADGADGFSPVVSVSSISGGHSVSITDAGGTETFNVMDGQDGSDGQPGADGHSPVLTSSKSEKVTTIYSDGVQLAQISDGEDGQGSDVIDDTAGAGDTNKTWSADKLTSDVLSAIDKLTPNATSGDIGKAIIVKTVENGKPSSYEYGEAGGGSVDPSAIAQAVDDWCDENITNPDSPPLDRSLTGSSAAAPADMVGAISNMLNMQDATIDLIAQATHTNGKKIDENGQIQSVSTYEIWEIEYDGTYDKINAVLYSGSNYQLRAMSFQDANGTALKVLEYLVTSSPYKSEFVDVTVPSGTKKIILANRNSMSPVSATCTIKKSKRLADIESDVNSLNVFSVSNKNLYDDSKKVVGLIYESNGTLIESYTDYRASDYIEISPSTIYTISGRDKTNGEFSTEGLRYAFYTSAKVFISGAKPEGKHSTFRTPSTAKYIRFSMNATYSEKWQLERRPFATNYVPFNTITLNDESDEMFLNYPQNVYVANGLEYNLYAFNVTPERHEGQFYHGYKEADNKIVDYGRFLRFKDSHTSTSEIKVAASFKSITKCGDKLFKIIPCDQTNLDNVSVLVLGDSTTANGYVVTDLHGYSGNENKITTLGTLGTAPYNHEGRSGWRLVDYFTQATNNPFYNPNTQTFDAEYYFTQTHVAVPDLFIINLGINDMHYDSGSLYGAKQAADTFISRVNTVITSLRSVDANMKVAICMTIPPNVDPWGFGAAGTNIIGYDAYRIANLVLCEKLIDEFDYRESEGLYLIPINLFLDTKYNMPTSAQLPNSRATDTIIKPDTAGNVHPNASGYYQIADAIYAFLCGTFKTT